MGDEIVCPEATPDNDGGTSCELVVSIETTSIALEVRDLDNATGTDILSLNITPTASPEAEIIAPVTDGVFYIDQRVTFEGLDAEGEDRLWQIVLDHGRDLAHFLHRHSDLRELGIEEAIGLSQASRRRELVAGNAIYRQGHEADGEDSIFLLLAGRVTLEVRVRDARNVPYATLEPGDLFGGHPLVARTPNPDSAICESDCQLLEIDRDAFRYLRISKPWTAIQLASAVLRVSSVRLGRMIGAVSETR